MAYVTIPKDLTKVKNKVAFNLTLRQIICIVLGAAVGIPFYFLTREPLGTSVAATGMVLLMLPEFLFAMYEKDGMHLEQILKNIISVRFKRPAIRRYETVNLYEKAVRPKAALSGAKKGAGKKGGKKFHGKKKRK
ncbi:PrgI family protein [Lacrimispora indolis]|uniref:PrgI family protein n=1 Tax=Lacrimispora indolis TaxID=69825 RepID=UPI0004018293|nr:PrgI family protein [[Clostridium] methoxybenzovorans]